MESAELTYAVFLCALCDHCGKTQIFLTKMNHRVLIR